MRSHLKHTFITKVHQLKVRPCRLFSEKFPVAKAEFQHMLNLRRIRSSSSPRESQLHMNPNSKSYWGPCGDYCALENAARSQTFTISLKAYRAKEFSWNQICYECITTYLYHQRTFERLPSLLFDLYEFLRMHFGLRNSTQIFHEFMN